jgi:hypothetical protein
MRSWWRSIGIQDSSSTFRKDRNRAGGRRIKIKIAGWDVDVVRRARAISSVADGDANSAYTLATRNISADSMIFTDDDRAAAGA